MRQNIKVTHLLWVMIVIFILFVPPLYAQDKAVPFPQYGSGPVLVSIYSNYSCPPCREMEPLVEPVLHDLLKRNAITLILVDVPFSESCILCAKYFLYALKKKNDAGHAFLVKNVIYNATAGKRRFTEAHFQELFKKEGIPFEVFDASPVFQRYNDLMKGDNITATPTCVIVKNGKKEKLTGGPDIIAAIKRLL